MTDIEQSSSSFDTSNISEDSEGVQSNQSGLKILDGKFFSLLKDKCDIRSNRAVGICQLCEPKALEIKGQFNVSTNFLKHLKRKHGPAAVEDYNKYVEGKKTCRRRVQTSRAVKITLNQEEFNHLIAKAIVSSMIPFRVVEDKWFREIFHQLNIDFHGLAIPSRQSVVKTTYELLEHNNEQLQNLLQETTYVCATADIWSGKKRSFMGVTVHWISNTYERRSAALACR